MSSATGEINCRIRSKLSMPGPMFVATFSSFVSAGETSSVSGLEVYLDDYFSKFELLLDSKLWKDRVLFEFFLLFC